MTHYKLFTYDRCSPIQLGDPVWDGSFPFDLPPVTLDTGPDECGRGWNFVSDLAAGFRLVGLWPSGWPSLVTVVEPGPDIIVRGDKVRASTGTLVRVATPEEVREGITDLSRPFGEHCERMVAEQVAWREALARPLYDAAVVKATLRVALDARGLHEWKLTQYDTGQAARAAWDAQAARDAWTAWDARAVRDARAARAARDAWAAWAARAALSSLFAALQGWTTISPDLYTVGIRDAYRYGLGVVGPVSSDTLGWALHRGEQP